MHSIETRSLTKSFGNMTAVDDVSMTVQEGEIFGFLGPNGAGKSTTMMILTTLLRPTSGQALIAGHDVSTDPKRVRENIGYVQQETTADEYLTGRENLLLQARLSHMEKKDIDSRIDAVLALVELEDRQNDPVVVYSGGMRKRLDIAGGLLHRPRVLFLDEPTVGLDIQTRTKLWEYIRRIHTESEMTVFLSTHYMEEADRLCDRIGIIDSGRMQAVDSPENMKKGMGGEMISITVDARNDMFLSALSVMNQAEVTGDGQKIKILTSDGTRLMPDIFEAALKCKAKIESVSLERPTLDDVFISYTGRQIRDERFNRQREHAKMRRLRA
ncbi:MAG: ATP-binding cassette domain-containing protein [Nitrosopumilus sp. H8]|nr:MAG: ATP-binding cassette domain-containing protein [Nitrosopumilus sp. H8]